MRGGDEGAGTKAHSDEELLDELRRVANVADSDGAPSISEFDEYSDIADSTIHRRFGSWTAALVETFDDVTPPLRARESQSGAQLTPDQTTQLSPCARVYG